MTPDQARPIDAETLAAQLHKYVLEPLHSPGLAKAVRAAADAINDMGAVAERQPRPPRITDNLPSLHRRYRRKP